MSFESDYKYGTKNEIKLLPKVKEIYGDKMKMTSQMCRWDFQSDNVIIELKSRKCNYNSYPSTMIPKAKIDAILEDERKAFCLFDFYDGLYALEITKDVVSTFRISKGGRCDRGKQEYQLYYYIPISKLNRL